ncbi:MAG: carboxypeptidase regulatory-like domain-containing protein [Bacteroidales bacterium]|nr:carboxypeptidase regulatory-like domain-containing protein [Bacteroidales bacterium]
MKKSNFILILALMVIVFGCNKDPKKNDTPVNPNYVTKTVSGIAVDENEVPLVDVDVNVNGNITTTDQSGAFFLPNISVPKDSFLVKFSKDGYFRNVRSGEPGSESNIRVRVGLVNKASATTTQFQANVGGILSIWSGTLNTTVTFPNDLKYTDPYGTPYTGTVIAIGYYVDPSAQNFSTLECGTQIGRDSTHAKKHLSTYGALYMEITDDQGGILKLDPTSPSFPSILMAIPGLLSAAAPTDIFVWSNNFDKSYSNSEGHGSKQGGNYMCQVRHFSYWQTAVPHTGSGTIVGRVTDTYGDPVAGVKVTIGQYYAVTNFNGNYRLEVPDNLSIPVSVLGVDYFGQGTVPIIVPPLNDGQVDTANLVVPVMQTLSGNVINCVGNNIPAFVKFTFYDPQVMLDVTVQSFAQYGHFELHVPLNVTSGTLLVHANGTSAIEYPTLNGSTGGTQDVEICVVQLGPSVVNISGGVYGAGTNYQFDYTDGYFMTSSMQTDVYLENSTTYENVSIYFDGNTTGTFNIYSSGMPKQFRTGGDTAMIYLDLDTNFLQMNYGTLEVTRYDGVGGLIEGTFSGTAMDYSGNSYQVSSAEFSVQRSADQGAKKKRK